MDVIVFVGRVLFVLVFLGSGVGHLTQTDGTAGFAASRGVPSPRLMAQISGVVMLIGGLAVILGVWTDLAFLGIGLLSLIFGVTMHRFWEDEGEQRQGEMAHFMKNLSIAGGAVALFGFFAYGYDAWQVVGPALSLE